LALLSLVEDGGWRGAGHWAQRQVPSWGKGGCVFGWGEPAEPRVCELLPNRWTDFGV